MCHQTKTLLSQIPFRQKVFREQTVEKSQSHLRAELEGFCLLENCLHFSFIRCLSKTADVSQNGSPKKRPQMNVTFQRAGAA